MHVFRFPFDTQSCPLKFYVGGTMAYVELETRPVEFDVFCAGNDEWSIQSYRSNIEYRCFALRVL